MAKKRFTKRAPPPQAPQAVAFETRSEALRKSWPIIPARDRQYLAVMHRHYVLEFKRNRDDPNKIGLAATIHDLADKAISDAMSAPEGATVKCRKGCGACCRIHVSVTEQEAALLLEYAQDQGIAIDWARVERQAKFGDVDSWSKQPAQDLSCVFLGPDESCGVYEHRPTACRKHLAITDPDLCDMQKHPGGQVGYLVSHEAEVLFSASLVALDNGSLAVMLLKVKGQHERTSVGLATAAAASS